MEVVVFETEDVITTSGIGCFDGYVPDVCGADGGSCSDFGCRTD